MKRATKFGWALLSLVLAVASTTGAAFAADEPDDTVFLKSGGRVRGAVVEQDPVKGVRIKLADGTIRNIPAADVKEVIFGGAGTRPGAVPGPAPGPGPAAPVPGVAPPPAPVPPPPEAAGSIRVESSVPGTVSVDDGVIGPAPVDVKNAAPGRHRVRVDFEGGGSEEMVVLVQSGQTALAKLEPSMARRAFASRKGMRFLIGAEPMFTAAGLGANFGIRGVGGINLGLAPAADFRVTGFFGGMWGNDFPYYQVGGQAAIRVNIGSTYSMEFGFQGGAAFFSGNSLIYPFAFFGPEASVLSFRFGEQRQIEVGVRQGMTFFAGDDFIAVYEQGLTFTYLFMPAAPPKAAARARFDHAY
jgi:hypothetical protein